MLETGAGAARGGGGGNEAARDDYRALYQGFHWLVPRFFNVAEVCATRWANRPNRTAIIHEDERGRVRRISYRELHRDANRLANALQALGVARGDRVAILLPQRPEVAVAHFACYRLGAIAMPMSVMFGPEALAYRYEHSEAHVAIVDAAALEATTAARGAALRSIVVVGSPQRALRAAEGELSWQTILGESSERFDPARTLSTDPAVLIYTSGTTGPPKGALIPHSAMLGNLTGFVASQDWFPQPGDVFWSPADWAWTGGLWDALLPTLYFGMPIVAQAGRFAPDKAFELMERHGVTNSFLFPTALKMMMRACDDPARRFELRLRAVMSAGESVGQAVFDWSREALGLTVNEMFGQTEINYVVGNSSRRWPARAGSIGRPYPGHRVAVIDDAGDEVPPGTLGEVAVHRRDIHGHADPVLFIGYWRNLDATERKFSGDWCRTGDLAVRDDDGYFWYGGRADDMFKAAGYRIGPSEIENCLLQHPAVANVAVVPKPDAERGNIVKAYVVATPGTRIGQQLIEALQQHVRGRLAPYEYPKEIEFIDELPMTTTGKIQRRVLRQRELDRAAQRDPAAQRRDGAG